MPPSSGSGNCWTLKIKTDSSSEISVDNNRHGDLQLKT